VVGKEGYPSTMSYLRFCPHHDLGNLVPPPEGCAGLTWKVLERLACHISSPPGDGSWVPTTAQANWTHQLLPFHQDYQSNGGPGEFIFTIQLTDEPSQVCVQLRSGDVWGLRQSLGLSKNVAPGESRDCMVIFPLEQGDAWG